MFEIRGLAKSYDDLSHLEEKAAKQWLGRHWIQANGEVIENKVTPIQRFFSNFFITRPFVQLASDFNTSKLNKNIRKALFDNLGKIYRFNKLQEGYGLIEFNEAVGYKKEIIDERIEIFKGMVVFYKMMNYKFQNNAEKLKENEKDLKNAEAALQTAIEIRRVELSEPSPLKEATLKKLNDQLDSAVNQLYI